ncbi:hypothetical protein V3H18_08095 [Methylocystis sp. 9N]|uniref:DUF2268 domain-containing protein n=1 Tax=Methylocystis borbori TaxID=3118750 RepID=A0ABU7XHI4_9HYPH
MGVWDISRLWRRVGAAEKGDPAIAEIAGEICRNLAALGLFVESKQYGTSFWEIRASTSPKMITTPDGTEASGVALLLAGKFEPPALVFEQINSLRRGLGREMVEAAIAGLKARPAVFGRVKVNDLSPRMKDGRRWWEHVADAHAEFDWAITHEEPFASASRVAQSREPSPLTLTDIAATPDFLKKRRKLEALCRELGYDAKKATLSPEKKTFDYLGQSFASEGESFPNGRIVIFYDPEMSKARLGCCLAHEMQHVKYFFVRDAYRAEPEDGPLHKRFAKFTPAALALLRGVSNYSNEHWDAWKGAAPPRLFSMELEEGESEPINETIAEVAKAQYNWGPDVWINPVWRELQQAINEEYERLRG